MKIGNANPYIIDFDPFGQSTMQATEIGAHMDISDGRSFHYAKAGASNLGVGKLGAAPTPKTNHHNLAVQAASAIGSNQISVTLGATASVAQEYAEGLISVNLTPGQGVVYKISDQPATGSAGTQTVTVFDPIQVALTTSSKATLTHNAWNNTVEGVIQTKRAAGVPMAVVTAGSYYWAQTKGVAATLNDGTIALGSRLTFSGSVSGAVAAESGTYTTTVVTTPVGVANIVVGVDTQYMPVFLTVE